MRWIGSFLLVSALSASAQNYVKLWQVGFDDNTQVEFAQENGNSNAEPGSAAFKDDVHQATLTSLGTVTQVMTCAAATDLIGAAP